MCTKQMASQRCVKTDSMIFKTIVVFFIYLSVCYGLDYSIVLKDDYVELKIPTATDIFVKDELTQNEYILFLNGEVRIDEELWGYDIRRVQTLKDGKFSKVIFAFENKPYRPDIRSEKGFLTINFPQKNNQISQTGNAYSRMFMGIAVLVVFILFCYFLLKIMMKKQLNSNIPGAGRLLGKVDIFPGKSLVFYDLAECIYIFSMTSDSLILVDKVYEDVVCDKIREGFTRKKDFSSYLRFFGKNIDDKDITITAEVLKEKVERLRKK